MQPRKCFTGGAMSVRRNLLGGSTFHVGQSLKFVTGTNEGAENKNKTD